MQINVPFVYEAMAVRHHHRKSERVLFGDTVSVDIAEVTEGEAPVVAVLRDLDDIDGKWRRTDLRSWDGRLWTVDQVYVDFEDDPVPLDARDVTAARLIGDLMNDHSRSHLSAFVEDGQTNTPSEFREIEHDDRAFMCEAIRKAAEDKLVVGGHVWRPVSAPMLRLEVWEMNDGKLGLDGEVVFAEATAAALEEKSKSGRRGDRCLLIGLNDLPVYEALLERVSDDHCANAPKVEVLDAGEFGSVPVFGWSVARRALLPLKALERKLNEIDEDVVVAWATLKKAARKVVEIEDLVDVHDKDVDNILEAWKNFYTCRGFMPEDAYFIARDAWAARPVALPDMGFRQMREQRL